MLFVEGREVIEIETVAHYEILVAGKIEQLRKAIRGRVSERFRVNQILPFVLQLDIGSDRVDIQADSRFLEFGGLFVESLCKSDPRACGIAGGESAKNQQILIHHQVDHSLPRSLFVRARLACAFAADLVSANLREVQNCLRKSRTGFDYLKGAGHRSLCVLNALKVVLINRALPFDTRLRKQGRKSNVAISIAFERKQASDDALRILF